MGSWMLPVTATAFAAGLLLWPELPIVARSSGAPRGRSPRPRGSVARERRGGRPARCARPSSPGAAGTRRRACGRRSPGGRRHSGRDRSPRRRRRSRAGDRLERPPRSRARHVAPRAARAAARDDRGRPADRSLRRHVRLVGGRPGPPGRVGGGRRLAPVSRLDQRRRARSRAARRGDRVRLDGVLRVPDDPGFASILRHKGIPAQLGLDAFTRLGPSASAFVRTTQSVRGDRRSLDRARVPAEGGGAAARPPAGRRLRARPGARA